MPDHDVYPLVTVIMPVRNEAHFIRQSLGAVLAQDYPADRLEILVVDGDSTDHTVTLVHDMAGDDTRVRVLHNPDLLQTHALNLALEAARGDIIVRVDGHTIIAPDYVRQCVYHLRTTGADAVGGPLRSTGTTPLSRAIAVGYCSPFGVPSRYRISRRAEYVDHVFLGAWPRELFEHIGKFNPGLTVNEDYEFHYRVRKAGGRIYLSPDIASEYHGRRTLGGLALQYFRYGADKFRMVRQHPSSIRPRQLVAPTFVAALVGGVLLAPLHRWIKRLWQVMIVCYALVNLTASLREAACRDDRSLAIRLPAVFATMHLSWGSGFWVELLRQLWQKLIARR